MIRIFCVSCMVFMFEAGLSRRGRYRGMAKCAWSSVSVLEEFW
jgi:hypothetical protein